MVGHPARSPQVPVAFRRRGPSDAGMSCLAETPAPFSLRGADRSRMVETPHQLVVIAVRAGPTLPPVSSPYRVVARDLRDGFGSLSREPR